jgi:hypothetical protein
LGLELQVLQAHGPSDFEDVVRAATRAHAGAILVMSSPIFNTYRRVFVNLAAKYRLPATCRFLSLRLMAVSWRMGRI